MFAILFSPGEFVWNATVPPQKKLARTGQNPARGKRFWIMISTIYLAGSQNKPVNLPETCNKVKGFRNAAFPAVGNSRRARSVGKRGAIPDADYPGAL
jgi:hypothetical protein